MAVTSETSSYSHTGDGAETDFDFDNRFLADSDLVVTVAGVTKTLGVDYTVTGAGVDAGGTVVFGSAPANAAAIVISRTVPIKQTAEFRTQGPFAAQTHEDRLDYLTFIVQQLERRLAATEADVTALEDLLESLGY